jgi:hypothetical protein
MIKADTKTIKSGHSLFLGCQCPVEASAVFCYSLLELVVACGLAAVRELAGVPFCKPRTNQPSWAPTSTIHAASSSGIELASATSFSHRRLLPRDHCTARRYNAAHVIFSPARALVLLPIQFVFDPPQRNAEAKSSCEQFFSVHRHTSFFAGKEFTTNMPSGKNL